jgi:hypothetical protein
MKSKYFLAIILALLALPTIAKSPCNSKEAIETIKKLDSMASYFKDLKCKVDDKLCWWFKFHLAIGASGPQTMTKFAEIAPLNKYTKLGYGSFTGEAHIAQYPAYWLLKGVKTNTRLSSGKTIEDYILGTPWMKVYTDTEARKNPVNVNEELSWYWITRSFYPQLKQIEQSTYFEESCGGGHHITGLYFANDPEFPDELKRFTKKVNGLILAGEKSEYKNSPYVDLYRLYFISHIFEAAELTGNSNVISNGLIKNASEHTDKLYKHFKEATAKAESPESFVEELKKKGHSIYYYGDSLGHLLYGLKMCAGMDEYQKTKVKN